jgi:hypothetical protein
MPPDKLSRVNKYMNYPGCRLSWLHYFYVIESRPFLGRFFAFNAVGLRLNDETQQRLNQVTRELKNTSKCCAKQGNLGIGQQNVAKLQQIGGGQFDAGEIRLKPFSLAFINLLDFHVLIESQAPKTQTPAKISDGFGVNLDE